MKVCFISPLGYGLYRPESEYSFGGAEVQFFLLSHAVSADQAFQVSVLTTVQTQPGTEQHGLLTVFKRQAKGRLTVRQTDSWWDSVRALWGYGAAFREMYGLLRSLDADVYLHAGAGVEVGAYALICRLLRRRFVYVVVSSADLGKPSEQVQGALAWLYPLGLRLADAVVCQTREHLALLKSKYGRDGTLIRPGHRLREPSRQERHAVLWVGRGHPLKQPEMFLALAEQLPKERCVMVIMRDRENEELRQSVRDRSARLPNVEVHESVPWEEVERFFDGAKLFVNTSTYEGFPNTFVQAALQGTPILSWSVDPDAVLARDGIGVCANGSFDRLVAFAQQLCSADDLRIEIGRRALEYARKNHDLDQSVGELKALVCALAGRPPVMGKR
jgi:glycosyltransferase involved in cell wall biosynthesis